ncbi:MAG: hypothetical protein H7A25_19535 [Leptospiraceae bacterium]|nr:hypothetical protein [Leptospiraceae bacterium]MCP5502099.1 hypothetical protein [Leptospiraceae bacterium]
MINFLSKTTTIMIFSLFLSFIWNCTYNKSSDVEQEKITLGILVGAGKSGTSCSSAATFSSLGSAGVTSKCSSCHSSTNATAGVDMTSYSSVAAKVVAKNPAGSDLYKTISSGSMSKYADSSIKEAVYCWIQAGATQ